MATVRVSRYLPRDIKSLYRHIIAGLEKGNSVELSFSGFKASMIDSMMAVIAPLYLEFDAAELRRWIGIKESTPLTESEHTALALLKGKMALLGKRAASTPNLRQVVTTDHDTAETFIGLIYRTAVFSNDADFLRFLAQHTHFPVQIERVYLNTGVVELITCDGEKETSCTTKPQSWANLPPTP